MTDFSNSKKLNKYYGGSERKIAIIYKNAEYIIKFQKYTNFNTKIFNHVSEYLGSHIFSLFGMKAQETTLGIYNGEEVVAVKNFTSDNVIFVPFNDVGESTLNNDKDNYCYSYEDITQMLIDNSKLTNVKQTIKVFWKMFIIDALIGNFDRHGANWGFLKTNDTYTISPVFDNGSCLYPQLNDEDMMKKIMKSTEETDKRINTFPTSQILLNGKKSSYYEVINSLSFKECNEALVEVYNLYDENKINKLIDETIFISDIHKGFYKYMIHQRYEKIIKSAYIKLKEQKL